MSDARRESLDANQCTKPDVYGDGVCVLENLNQCKEYHSSRLAYGLPHNGNCDRKSNIEQSKIGQCGDGGRCASVMELCPVPGLFKPEADDCEVLMSQENDSDDGVKTTYGSCEKDGVRGCYWSSDDCDNPSTFRFDDDCTCDMVRIGGCLYDNVVWCSVSEQACSSTETWVAAGADEVYGRRCYLCRAAPAPPTTNSVTTPQPTSQPTSQPTRQPTSAPVTVVTGAPQSLSINNPDGLSINRNQINSAEGGGNTGVVIGGVVGGIVLAGVLIAAVVLRTRGKRETTSTAQASSGKILQQKPTTTDSNGGEPTKQDGHYV